MVDADLEPLFSEDQRVLGRTVRSMIRSVVDESDLEGQLVDLLETSLEHQNDDSSASLCATIILGEARSTRAIGVLQRSLASDNDETLQDAASVALLRIGAPAVLSLLEALEDEADPRLCAPAYSLLGMVGALEDDGLKQATRDFLESRVEVERKKAPGERALEQLFRASAQLGHRELFPLMKRVLAEDYHGHCPGIQDSIEMLEENTAGVPLVTSTPPWEERYGWLFDDDPEEARVARRRPALEPLAGEDQDLDKEPDDDRDMSLLFWGLSATTSGRPRLERDDEPGGAVDPSKDDPNDEDDGYDARRYLDRPGD